MSDLDVYDDPELRDALHAAVAGGPPSPPLDDLMAVARRARRGRQTRRAVGGLAVAAALTGVVLAGAQVLDAPGGGSDGSDDRTGIAEKDRSRSDLDLGVVTDQQGRLVAEPGTTIERTVRNVLGPDEPGRAYGVVSRRDGVETWGLVTWTPAGTMTSVEPARSRFAAFDDWLAYEVGAMQGSPEPHPVAFAPDGTLRPTGAVRIVQQRSGVDLGPAPDGTMTAAAEVSAYGRDELVLARLVPGGRPDYVVLEPQEAGSTFEALVARAAELFAAREQVTG